MLVNYHVPKKCVTSFMDDLFTGNSLSDDGNYDQSCRGSEVLKEHNPPLLFDLVSEMKPEKVFIC